MSILEVNGLKKVYSTRLGGNKVEALKNVNFSVEEGEYVAIMVNPAPARPLFSTYLRPWTSPPQAA